MGSDRGKGLLPSDKVGTWLWEQHQSASGPHAAPLKKDSEKGTSGVSVV